MTLNFNFTMTLTLTLTIMQEIEALFTLGDSNNDGEIDLEEFVGVLYPVVAKALAKLTKGNELCKFITDFGQ